HAANAAILRRLSVASRGRRIDPADSADGWLCSGSGRNVPELGRENDLDRRAVQREQDALGRAGLNVRGVVSVGVAVATDAVAVAARRGCDHGGERVSAGGVVFSRGRRVEYAFVGS